MATQGLQLSKVLAHLRKSASLSLLCLIPLFPNALLQAAPKTPVQNAAQVASPQTQSAITITLKASREQPSAGSDFGISADVENISDKSVYLQSQGFTMTAPPELDSEGPSDWFAWLPGPYVGSPTKDDKDKTPEEYKKVVVLAPHSRISVFWTGKQSSKTEHPHFDSLCNLLGEDCATLLRNINFPPGKYTINVIGSYWDNPTDAQNKAIDRRTQIAAIDLPIVAPQATIILGAVLGGIFAYLLILLPTRKYVLLPTGIFRIIGDVFVAVLLAVIVTILLSRLSESQFLVKVSVSDFWGAITVGFVATAVGPTVLRRISSVFGSSSTTQAHTQTAINSSPNPSNNGAAVTFNATVAGTPTGFPAGTVTFKEGSSTLGTDVLNSGGQATFTTSSLSNGSHAITAVYGGDSNFAGSTSAVLTQVVS